MKEKIRIYGIPLPLYLTAFAAVFLAMQLDCLPGGMIGVLMRNPERVEVKKNKAVWDIQQMGLGMLLSFLYYLGGTVLSHLLPSVHTYAWMILLTGITKALGAVPEAFEQAAWQWSRFVLKNWTHGVLIGIGISLIDLEAGWIRKKSWCACGYAGIIELTGTDRHCKEGRSVKRRREL